MGGIQIRVVIPQDVTIGEVSGTSVPGGSAQCGKTPQKHYVTPLHIQGGGGPRGDGDADPM